jgi:hypothetical protein
MLPLVLRTAVHAALVGALAFVVAACGPWAAPNRADDIQGIFAELARSDLRTSNVLPGESGCDDPELRANAVRFRVSGAGDAEPRDVYLFVFKHRAGYEAGRAAVDACQKQFEARSARPGGPVTRLDVQPYRAFGDGWGPGLTRALHESLRLAAGNGGDPSATPLP